MKYFFFFSFCEFNFFIIDFQRFGISCGHGERTTPDIARKLWTCGATALDITNINWEMRVSGGVLFFL